MHIVDIWRFGPSSAVPKADRTAISSAAGLTSCVHAEDGAVASAELEARPQRLVKAPAASRSREGGSFTSEVVGVACRFPGEVTGQQFRQGSVDGVRLLSRKLHSYSLQWQPKLCPYIA